jgi:hypothetical protein
MHVVFGFAAPQGRQMCASAHGLVTKNTAGRRALIEGACGLADASQCYVHAHASAVRSLGHTAPPRRAEPRVAEPEDAVTRLLRQWDAAEFALRG